MGTRLSSDVDWYMNENPKMKLSEDGFCSNCEEFHADCFCIAFWVRKSASLSKNNSDHRKIDNERRDFMEKFEINRCSECLKTKSTLGYKYCDYHQLKMERMGLA